MQSAQDLHHATSTKAPNQYMFQFTAGKLGLRITFKAYTVNTKKYELSTLMSLYLWRFSSTQVMVLFQKATRL